MLGLSWHPEPDSAWLPLCQQDGLIFLMGRLATSRAQESSTSKTGISQSGNLEMSLEVQQNHLQFSFAFVLNCIWGRHHSLFHAFKSLRVLTGPGQQAQQLGSSDYLRLDYDYESLWSMAAPPGHGHLQWRHLVAYALPWGMSLNLPQSCSSLLEEGKWAPVATVRRWGLALWCSGQLHTWVSLLFFLQTCSFHSIPAPSMSPKHRYIHLVPGPESHRIPKSWESDFGVPWKPSVDLWSWQNLSLEPFFKV